MTADLPRAVLVTGATGAIGRAIAAGLAAKSFHVVVISRSLEKAAGLAKELQEETGNPSISYQAADLSSQASVQALSSNWEGPLHVLINNAAESPRERLETPAGIERQFATNVLGYFWMTRYFTDILATSAPARIINVASYWAGGLDLTDLEFRSRPYHNHAAYRQSKQANRMLTPVFAEQLQPLGITVNSCHPGDVNSRLSNDLGFGGSQSPAEGADTPVWLATSAELDGKSGGYYESRQLRQCQFARLKDESRKLHDLCLAYGD